MKMHFLNRLASLCVLGVGLGCGLVQLASALPLTPCCITLPGGATVTAFIDLNGLPPPSSYSAPAYAAVSAGAILPGVYPAWCIEEPVGIDPGLTYSGGLYSSCDSALSTPGTWIWNYLAAYHSASELVPVEAWDSLNWILNHRTGYDWEDVQLALWSFVGGPPSIRPWFFDQTRSANNPNVQKLVTDASAAVSGGWSPACGDEIGLLAVIDPGYPGTPNPAVQLLLIEVFTVGHGNAATIGFWHNKNGQALVNSFNGGKTSKNLGNWLASNFGCLFGDLGGKQNSDVAARFLDYFNVKGTKTYAQILAGALACYATSSTLAGGKMAAKYGFDVSSTGVGNKFYNVGSNGAAIGLANNTSYPVWVLLQAANHYCSGGKITSIAFNALNNIFDGINSTGDIN